MEAIVSQKKITIINTDGSQEAVDKNTVPRTKDGRIAIIQLNKIALIYDYEWDTRQQLNFKQIDEDTSIDLNNFNNQTSNQQTIGEKLNTYIQCLDIENICSPPENLNIDELLKEIEDE